MGLQAHTQIYFNKIFQTDTTNILTRAVLPTNDGYLDVGGYATTTEVPIYLRKLDSMGNMKWMVFYEYDDQSAQVDAGSQFIETNDGNYIILYGEVHYEQNEVDIRLLKVDKDGVPLWNRKFTNPDATEIPKAVIQTSDGGYAITGLQQFPEDTARYYLLKADSNGNFEWDATYKLDDSSIAFSVAQTEDGGFLIGGAGFSYETDYDMYIVRTDAVGNQLWDMNLGGGVQIAPAILKK